MFCMARLLMNDEEIGLPIHRGTAYTADQDGREGVQASGAHYLEALQGLPPLQLGANQDELLQTPGGESDGQDV